MFYILRNPRNSLNKILKLMVTMTRSKLKSRLQHDASHLQPLSNDPTKHQPLILSFRDKSPDQILKDKVTAVRSKVKINQGHIMTLHTYNSQPMSLPNINFLHLTVLRYSPDKILKVKVTTAIAKVESRSHHDIAHLHPLTSIPTKYQLPTPYGF